MTKKNTNELRGSGRNQVLFKNTEFEDIFKETSNIGDIISKKTLTNNKLLNAFIKLVFKTENVLKFNETERKETLNKLIVYTYNKNKKNIYNKFDELEKDYDKLIKIVNKKLQDKNIFDEESKKKAMVDVRKMLIKKYTDKYFIPKLNNMISELEDLINRYVKYTENVITEIKTDLKNPDFKEKTYNVELYDDQIKYDTIKLLFNLATDVKLNTMRVILYIYNNNFGGEKILALNDLILNQIRKTLNNGFDEFIRSGNDTEMYGSDVEFNSDIYFANNIQIKIIKKDYSKIKAKEGGFFPYLIKDKDFYSKDNLKLYGLYDELDKDNYNINCVMKCVYAFYLKNVVEYRDLTQKNSSKLDIMMNSLKHYMNTRSVQIRYLKKIGKKCDLRIKLKYYRDNKDYKHRTRARVYNKNGKHTINIGLVNDHFFLITKTKYTKYALKNYKKVREYDNWNNIRLITKTNKIRYAKNDNDYADTFDLFTFLLRNKDDLLEMINIGKLYLMIDNNISLSADMSLDKMLKKVNECDDKINLINIRLNTQDEEKDKSNYITPYRGDEDLYQDHMSDEYY
jgi:hypothetical protein